MPRYRQTGHIYYITTNVYNFHPIFTCASFVIPLLDSLNYYRFQYDVALIGYVIMRDHLHLLLFPENVDVLSAMIRDFKEFTAKRLIRQATVEKRQEWLDAFAHAGAVTGRSQNKVWQDSFWEMNLFSDRFIRQKLNYIHRNPVRAKLVDEPGTYPYSSYRNYAFDDESLIEIDRGWL